MLFIFSTPELIRNLWRLKTTVFLHWCLLRAVPLYPPLRAGDKKYNLNKCDFRWIWRRGSERILGLEEEILLRRQPQREAEEETRKRSGRRWKWIGTHFQYLPRWITKSWCYRIIGQLPKVGLQEEDNQSFLVILCLGWLFWRFAISPCIVFSPNWSNEKWPNS